jgi:hypothetical protein
VLHHAACFLGKAFAKTQVCSGVGITRLDPIVYGETQPGLGCLYEGVLFNASRLYSVISRAFNWSSAAWQGMAFDKPLGYLGEGPPRRLTHKQPQPPDVSVLSHDSTMSIQSWNIASLDCNFHKIDWDRADVHILQEVGADVRRQRQLTYQLRSLGLNVLRGAPVQSIKPNKQGPLRQKAGHGGSRL